MQSYHPLLEAVTLALVTMLNSELRTLRISLQQDMKPVCPSFVFSSVSQVF